MIYNEFKNKSVAELHELLNELKAELFTLRFKNKTGVLDQTHKIKAIRKDIARALTALNEKEKGAK